MKKSRHIAFLCMLMVWSSLFSQVASHAAKTHILGLGNSFTRDMLVRVPDILGADTALFDLSYLCIWGGSLHDQLDYIEQDCPDYLFFHYDNGAAQWQEDTVRFSQVIDSQRWDIFLLQQSSQYSGEFNTIRNDLSHLLQVLDAHHPDAQRYWHLTWAFANGSTHPGFPKYDCSQLRMYYAIVDAASEVLLKTFHDDFAGFIPTGTLIQTLRDSYLCDDSEFCRDTYHLDVTLGRYAASCMFYEKVLAPRLRKSILTAKGVPPEDSIHTAQDYAFVRQMAYDIAHCDSLVWGHLLHDRVYRTSYYDVLGRPLTDRSFRQPSIARYFHVSGRKSEERFIFTE